MKSSTKTLLVIGGFVLLANWLRGRSGTGLLGETASNLDVSRQEDLAQGCAHLISIEEHLSSSFASTRDQKYLDQLEGVRRMRRSAMARLLPPDAEAETWCICKHFLSGSMRMQETGSKLLTEGDRAGAGNCFEIASAMKDRALQVAANSGSGAQCNVCRGG